MIIYVSDSINSKKNGGSSTSGFEFLQFLRMKYKDVILITSDNITKTELGNNFYNKTLNPVSSIIVIRRKVSILDFTIRSIIRPIYYFLKDIGKKNSVNLDNYYTPNGKNLLFINSWSAINTSKTLIYKKKFTKICIVRGSPESFIYQSFETDKNEVINRAANYLEMFDKLIYVSENGLKSWSKIISKKIESFYLPNSINEIEINFAKKISKLEAAKKVLFNVDDYNIVIVGSVQKRKAQDILLKVVEEFLNIKPNLKFHIVGNISKTWGGDQIYNDVVNSLYADKFIFHGHSDDVVIFMQAADLLIFTSHAEAFPRTVAEYMALGKPIIAADVSGVSEMIIDSENGFLFDSLDPKSLIRAFTEIEFNDDIKKKISINAYNTYWNKFSKNIHISRSIDIFNKIDHE